MSNKTNGNSIVHTGEQSHIETFVTSGVSSGDGCLGYGEPS